MKLIDLVINDIPKVGIETYDNTSIKYVADSRVILDHLRGYEVEIPQDIYERYKDTYGNGVLQYMESLTQTKIEDFSGANTYNNGGCIMHDFHFMSVEHNGDFYVAVSVHRGGDIRGNYTDFVLFKFDYVEQWWEVVDDITYSYCSGVREIDGKHYFYDISIFSEYLHIWCQETEKDYEIYAYDDESFEKEIKKLEG